MLTFHARPLELFPPNNPLAQWMYALAILVQDAITEHRLVLRAIDRIDDHPDELTFMIRRSAVTPCIVYDLLTDPEARQAIEPLLAGQPQGVKVFEAELVKLRATCGKANNAGAPEGILRAMRNELAAHLGDGGRQTRFRTWAARSSRTVAGLTDTAIDVVIGEGDGASDLYRVTSAALFATNPECLHAPDESAVGDRLQELRDAWMEATGIVLSLGRQLLCAYWSSVGIEPLEHQRAW